jgi:sugar phosphate isomerase/epimerase
MSTTTPLSRRAALQLLAAGVAGGTLLPQLASAHAAPARRIDRIGLQLYTVRSAMTKDLEGTIAAIAAAGITELEFAGYYNKPAEWWRDTMKRHGLNSPSTHVGLPGTDAEWEPHFAMSKSMGQTWVIVPSIGRDYRSADGFKRLADRLNSGGALAKAAGLRMGYHNHDFEFAPLDSGTNGLSILLANTDPTLVDFELDLYWAVKAGQDPLAMIAAHPKRFVCCHVKDAGPAPARAMMDVGAGTIDFKTILAAGRKAGLRHWFIEHDQPTEPLASIAASAAALKKL